MLMPLRRSKLIDVGASFFLDLALRSMSAGNFEAAHARLEHCAELMKTAVASPDISTATASAGWQQLASVNMAMGDCCKGMARHQDAIRCFSESCSSLERCPADNIE
eukprot:scaffold215958_cov30-Prasinocladus_malaysianus.AAC.1